MSNSIRELLMKPKKEQREAGFLYTPHEIWSQPRVWMKNFEMLNKLEEEIKDFVKSRILSKPESSVILTGAGSSGFIGPSVEGLFKKHWRRFTESWHNTDIVTSYKTILSQHSNTALISFSRSGNSPEAIGAYKLAKKHCSNVSHVIVTCNKRGKLAQMKNDDNALLLVLVKEANDRGLAMTASFTTMLTTAQFLAHIQNLSSYEPIMKNLSKATERLFREHSSLIKNVAELDFERAFFLGTGALHGCALESHLKLQELTAGRVICKAETYLGLRHGPKVAINKKTLVVFYVSSDPRVRRYELDLMKDLHSHELGRHKMAICDRSDKEMEMYADTIIEIDPENSNKIPDAYRPVIDVTLGQMLGLFKSLSLGLKPDNPSESGVITRVVKGVKIYDNKAYDKQVKFKALTR
jgi:tagatose-6-phosphate ketose/aldose isomerase